MKKKSVQEKILSSVTKVCNDCLWVYTILYFYHPQCQIVPFKFTQDYSQSWLSTKEYPWVNRKSNWQMTRIVIFDTYNSTSKTNQTGKRVKKKAHLMVETYNFIRLLGILSDDMSCEYFYLNHSDQCFPENKYAL